MSGARLPAPPTRRRGVRWSLVGQHRVVLLGGAVGHADAELDGPAPGGAGLRGAARRHAVVHRRRGRPRHRPSRGRRSCSPMRPVATRLVPGPAHRAAAPPRLIIGGGQSWRRDVAQQQHRVFLEHTVESSDGCMVSARRRSPVRHRRPTSNGDRLRHSSSSTSAVGELSDERRSTLRRARCRRRAHPVPARPPPTSTRSPGNCSTVVLASAWRSALAGACSVVSTSGGSAASEQLTVEVEVEVARQDREARPLALTTRHPGLDDLGRRRDRVVLLRCARCPRRRGSRRPPPGWRGTSHRSPATPRPPTGRRRGWRRRATRSCWPAATGGRRARALRRSRRARTDRPRRAAGQQLAHPPTVSLRSRGRRPQRDDALWMVAHDPDDRAWLSTGNAQVMPLSVHRAAVVGCSGARVTAR